MIQGDRLSWLLTLGMWTAALAFFAGGRPGNGSQCIGSALVLTAICLHTEVRIRRIRRG